MLFLVESLIAVAAIGYYFRSSLIDSIEKVEKYTSDYSITMAEAFAEAAAKSYSVKSYAALRELFQEKITEGTLDEAFFVLEDGRLIVHSSSEKEAELKGNIATDEMSYNMHMILKPVREKSRSAVLSDYNIIDKEIPFSREQRNFIREHFYDKINVTGWLASRAVFVKDKPVGSVNFIISRERIHDVIHAHVESLEKWIPASLAVSFGVSFFVSIFVFVRQRRVENRALAYSSRRDTRTDEVCDDFDLTDSEIDLDLDIPPDETVIPEYELSEMDKIISEKVIEVEQEQLSPLQPNGDEYDEPITIEVLAEFDPDRKGAAGPDNDEIKSLHDEDKIFPEFERSGPEKASGEHIIRDAIPVDRSEISRDTN